MIHNDCEFVLPTSTSTYVQSMTNSLAGLISGFNNGHEGKEKTEDSIVEKGNLCLVRQLADDEHETSARVDLCGRASVRKTVFSNLALTTMSL